MAINDLSVGDLFYFLYDDEPQTIYMKVSVEGLTGYIVMDSQQRHEKRGQSVPCDQMREVCLVNWQVVL